VGLDAAGGHDAIGIFVLDVPADFLGANDVYLEKRRARRAPSFLRVRTELERLECQGEYKAKNT
jgi:hypothetical protein